MKITRIVRIAVFVLLVTPVFRLAAQTPPANPGAPEIKTAPTLPPPAPKEEYSVTDHTLRMGGQIIPYKATAGLTLLKNDAGEPIGRLYSVAYTRSDVKDLSRRPLSFFYNGGPGSASAWLHMGAFGPRRVGHDGRRLHPAAALPSWWTTPSSLLDNDRPGLHRRRSARASASRSARARARTSGASTRTPRRSASSSYLRQPQRPLELAQVPHRRELRHDPLRRAGEPAAEPRRRWTSTASS